VRTFLSRVTFVNNISLRFRCTCGLGWDAYACFYARESNADLCAIARVLE
jgi:hypothetical protein